MKTVDAKIVEKLVFRAHNVDSCGGTYYPEDNWNLEIICDTEEELIEQMAREITLSRIKMIFKHYTKTEFLVYQDKTFFVKHIEQLNYYDLLNTVRSTELYKKLEKTGSLSKGSDEDVQRARLVMGAGIMTGRVMKLKEDHENTLS